MHPLPYVPDPRAEPPRALTMAEAIAGVRMTTNVLASDLLAAVGAHRLADQAFQAAIVADVDRHRWRTELQAPLG